MYDGIFTDDVAVVVHVSELEDVAISLWLKLITLGCPLNGGGSRNQQKNERVTEDTSRRRRNIIETGH